MSTNDQPCGDNKKSDESVAIQVKRKKRTVHEGELVSLRRVKENVTEISQGNECGVGVAGFIDWREGDRLEAVEVSHCRAAPLPLLPLRTLQYSALRDVSLIQCHGYHARLGDTPRLTRLPRILQCWATIAKYAHINMVCEEYCEGPHLVVVNVQCKKGWERARVAPGRQRSCHVVPAEVPASQRASHCNCLACSQQDFLTKTDGAEKVLKGSISKAF